MPDIYASARRLFDLLAYLGTDGEKTRDDVFQNVKGYAPGIPGERMLERDIRFLRSRGYPVEITRRNARQPLKSVL